MKLKVTLTTATALGLIMTASAYAGGSSTYITQDGNSQSAAIDQSGSTSGASVGTSGTPFLQDNGATGGLSPLGIGGNILTITQTGSDNEVGVDTQSFQSGTANRANIEQDGTGNSANLQQTGAHNGPNGVQDVHGYWSNDADAGSILQNGSGGTVNVTQTNAADAIYGNAFNIGQSGTGNTSTVNQTGDNLVWIRQGTSLPDIWWGPLTPVAGALSDSTIDVTQNGGHVPVTPGNWTNYAAVAQGNGTLNHITIGQTGSANSADVNQSGDGNIFSSTQVSPTLNMDWNYVGGEAGWPGGDGPIVQTGNGNQYNNYQDGTNLLALGSQVGDSNYLTNFQYGDSNKLYSTQTGSAGDEIWNQQHGNDGTATYTQSGSYNVATLQDQLGSSNTVDVTQTGDGTAGAKNTVTMLQNGDTNSIVMEQSGLAGNEAYLVQGGTFSGAPFTTTTLSPGTAGDGNHIDGSQDGSTNYVAVSQNGNSNNANFSQTGTGNSAVITQ